MDRDCTVEVDDEVTTVRPAGELDFLTMDPLRATLRDATARAGLRRLVVDLSDVSSLDSSVLGLFVATRRTCQASDIGFRLTQPAPPVFRLLKVTNLYDLLVNESTVDADDHG